MKNAILLISLLLGSVAAFSQGEITGEWLAIKDELIFDFSEGDSLAIVQFRNRDDTSKRRYFSIKIEENQIKFLNGEEVFETMEIVSREEETLRIYDPSFEEEFHLVKRPMYKEEEISHFFGTNKAIEVSFLHPVLDTIVKEVLYPDDLINEETDNYCTIGFNYELECRELGCLLYLTKPWFIPSFSQGEYLIDKIEKDGFYAIPVKDGERVFISSRQVEKPKEINLEDFAGNYVIIPYDDEQKKNEEKPDVNVHTIYIGYSSLQLNDDGTFILNNNVDDIVMSIITGVNGYKKNEKEEGTWKLVFFDENIILTLLSQKKIYGIIQYKNYLIERKPGDKVVWILRSYCNSMPNGGSMSLLPHSIYLKKKG